MIEFLSVFPKSKSGLFIVYELFTFDNFFRLLLKAGFTHNQGIDFMIANCDFSAYVFQERIHNNEFYSLNEIDALSLEDASVRAKLIADLSDFLDSH